VRARERERPTIENETLSEEEDEDATCCPRGDKPTHQPTAARRGDQAAEQPHRARAHYNNSSSSSSSSSNSTMDRRRDGGGDASSSAPPPPPLNPRALAAKIQEYERFSNDVLKRDLQRVTELRARADREAKTWEELAASVRRTMPPPAEGDADATSSTPLKTLVEVAPGVHCRAVVPDPSRLCVAVGLGFHVECRSRDEALRVVELRREAAAAKSAALVEQAARLKAQIKFVGEALAELMRLPRR
jgi:hypothetical protein